MNHDKDQVLPAAVGMWQDIIQTLTGIDSKVFNGRHQSCPLCGGSDRFRFIRRHEKQFFCNVCGAHSGINFYMELAGIDFSTAINDVGDYLNLIPTEQREIINKKTIVTNSFPKWYRFDFDKYQKVKEEVKVGLSPWQRVNQLNMLDLSAYHQYTAFNLLNKDGEVCDIVLLDVEGNLQSTSGNTIEPDGFYSFVHGKQGDCIYITPKPLTAANFALYTGFSIIFCYSVENMSSVIHNFKDRSVVAVVSDMEETQEADDLGLHQLILNSNTRTVGRKLWSPGEIVKSRGK